nr:MAG TPA: hypothetical protein [Caudoviricetes sp.]
MEKEINIAEILKDKPQGTKLYDWLYNVDVELDTISNTDTETVVWCTNKTDNNTTCHRGYSRIGTVRGCPDGLQILLPSKSMRDWSKLAWKIGDLLTNECGFQCIFKEWASDDYTKFNGCYSNSRDGYEDVSNAETAKFEKLDDDIAHDYIKEIERKLGGKLNLDTLEIEKQPEFKDGDIVVYGKSVAICRKIYKHTLSFYVSLNEMFGLLFADEVESSEEYRFATEEEKQQLFDALAKEGKAWDAESKAIVDLKPKWNPKPFDRVVTRVDDDAIWTANIFSHIDKYGEYNTIGCVGGYPYCLPYNEETAKLIGTTDDWKGGEQ